MHRRLTPGLFVIFAAAILAHSPARAQPLTTAFTYQGELRNGAALASGSHDFRFRLYDALTAGAQVGPTLCLDNVALSSGRFAVSLDFGALFSGQQRFLEIEARQDTGLDCSSATGFTLLSPRQELTSSPNADFALSAASAATAANATQLNGQAASFYTNAANLTGTLPSGVLSGAYSGALTLSNASNILAGSGAGLTSIDATNISAGTLANGRTTGTFASTPNTLVLRDPLGGFSASGITATTLSGAHSGNGSALTSLNASNISSGTLDTARLVNPLSLSGPGFSYVFQGEATSDVSNTTALYGLASAAVGATIGLRGQSNSPNGFGVIGQADASGSGSSMGVYGHSGATGGVGVRGDALSTTGTTFGMYGRSSSPSPSAGVFGESTSSSGLGVRGQGETGVFGRCTTSGGKGVYGQQLSGTFGVFSEGNTGASGTKSFRIDHPSDPENKYLVHYCAESDEVINFYSGKAPLDQRGEAEVHLPAYFASINKDPRYTLTAIGAAMPLLHVATEVDERSLVAGNVANPGDAIPACSFRIAGGTPSGKVSWEVKALRNDRWVQQRGAPVEIDKPAIEKGTYQHPDLYGQPPERGAYSHGSPVGTRTDR